MKKFIVEKQIDIKTFIAQKLKISKTKAKDILDTKNTLVNGKRVWIGTYNLQKGDIVEVPIKQGKNNNVKITKKNIIYEDEFIIAVNKPPFLISESKKNSVEDQLRKIISSKIKAVHRLDKETSGVLIFAKNSNIFEKFKRLWENKQIKKIYYAISHNKANFKKKIVSIPIEKKFAKSTIYTNKTSQNYTLFKVDIKTGRKHQIRIHLAKIGHPIVCDKEYGYKTIKDPILKTVKRHMLHSYEISFKHPYTKQNITIKAKIPEDFMNLAKKLNLV